MGVASAFAREVRGHRARGRRRSVHRSGAERRRRARRSHGSHVLDVSPRARPRRTPVLRPREPGSRDPGRHLVHGHDRRAPARDRCEERAARVGHESRRFLEAVRHHDVPERHQGQSHRRHGRRRLRYSRLHRGVQREDRQGSLALLYDPRARGAWQRNLDRRFVEAGRRRSVERRSLRSADEPRLLGHR